MQKISSYDFEVLYRIIDDVKKISDVLNNSVCDFDTTEQIAAGGASWMLNARCTYAVGEINYFLEKYIDSLSDDNNEKKSLKELLDLKEKESEK